MNPIVARVFAILATCAAATWQAPQGKTNQDPKVMLAGSYQLQSSGDWAGAIHVMRDLVKDAPKSYFLRLRLAWLQLQKGEFEESVASYRSASQLEANAVEPLLGLQQALIAWEKYDEAEKVGRNVLRLDPNSYLGLSRQAFVNFKRQSYAASVELYLKVLELYPSDTEMLSGLGYAQLWLGKKSAAEATFQRLLANVPGHAGATEGLKYCK